MKKIILLFLFFYCIYPFNSIGQITQQPADYETCEGGTAFFEVQVQNPDDYTFQWQIEESPDNWINLENNDNYKSVDNDTLLIINTPFEFNGNRYRCELLKNMKTYFTDSAILIVNENLIVNVSIEASRNTICAGEEVTFTATPINGGSSPQYKWLVNNNTVLVQTDSTYTTSTLSHSDSVVCILTSSETCTSNNPATSNTISIIVNYPPIITDQPSDTSINCTIDITSFCLKADGTDNSYQWQNKKSDDIIWTNLIEDSICYCGVKTDSLQINSIPVDLNNNNFRCIVKNDCDSICSDTVALSISGLPKATILKKGYKDGTDNTPQLLICTKEGYEYQWYFNNTVKIPEADKQFYYPGNYPDFNDGEFKNGEYSVLVTNENECSNFSNKLLINENIEKSIMLNIYPNPTNQKFNISINGNLKLINGKTGKIRIWNNFGIIVKEFEILSNENYFFPNISINNKGIYFIEMIFENSLRDTQKLLIN